MSETEIDVLLERHDQYLKSLQHQVNDLREVQGEIRTMSETLVTLTTEIKHTNANVTELKQKVETIEDQPKARLNQIITAIIAALAGGMISAGVAAVLTLM
mgnify:FL=1